jgi:hypothetical protein
MKIATLNFLENKISNLNIPYEFGGWSDDTIPDPYFVGEYIETESATKEEDGHQDSTFILTGTGRSWMGLINAKETIEKNITQTAILEDKTGVAVFYTNSLIVPTGDAELKRIQINLKVSEWSIK